MQGSSKDRTYRRNAYQSSGAGKGRMDDVASSSSDYGPEPPRSWLVREELVVAIRCKIMKQLPTMAVAAMRLVHSTWDSCAKSDDMWRFLYGRDFSDRCGWPDLVPWPEGLRWLSIYSSKFAWFRLYYPNNSVKAAVVAAPKRELEEGTTKPGTSGKELHTAKRARKP